MDRVSRHSSLRNKLLALMVLRVVFALAFLGLTAWFQHKSQEFFLYESFLPLYLIVACMGLMTVIYALLLNKVANLTVFTYIQLSADVLLATSIVYVTGGMESYLSVLYPLVVIGGSILLNKRGGYYAASLASICYGVLIDLDYYRFLPVKYKIFSLSAYYSWEDVLTTIATNILAFFIVAYLSGYLAERTERVEKALREKVVDYEKLENLNRQIVDNVPSGIMTVNESGVITSFNRAASAITGYELNDVYYKHADEVFIGLFAGNIATAELGGIFERKFIRKDGVDVWLGITVSGGHGGELDKVVILQDFTAVKDMEERLRRDDRLRALGELSAAIAHEVRNPLASISGSIHVLNSELKLDGESRNLMEIVMRETKRLDALVTDFLLFAKPAKKGFEVFNISEVASETLKLFVNSHQAAGISIDDRIEPSPLMMEGDRRQVSQVFWNLFLNAAAAMHGSGALTVRVNFKDGDTGGAASMAVVEVIDTGHGIGKDVIPKIFDPFFSTKESGTGMGLAIVHRIVKSHGGEITVESEEGRGTVFRVFMPLCAHKTPA